MWLRSSIRHSCFTIEGSNLVSPLQSGRMTSQSYGEDMGAQIFLQSCQQLKRS